MVERMQAGLARNERAMNRIRTKMIDTGVIAYGLYRGLSRPIETAKDFEAQLVELGNKGNLSREQLRGIGRDARASGRRVNQGAKDMVEGLDFLVGMGMSVEKSRKAIEDIGKSATATGGSVVDLSKAGFSVIQNLAIMPDKLKQAFDIMAQGGKEGGFELKDMAQYFPAITAAARALGIQGSAGLADLVAALQVVRQGTGDGASAATNFLNILQKMQSPLTSKKFKEFGVDIRKELKRAADEGVSPIQKLLEVTNKALGGDLSKLGDIFADKQVQEGLRPLLQQYQQYLDLRERAGKAQGVIDQDFANKMETAEQKAKRFQVAIENMQIAIGSALLPALTRLAEAITPIIDRIAAFADANPRLVQTVTAAAAALVSLRIAALGVQFAFGWMKGGALLIAAKAFAPVTAAVTTLGAALAATGIGAILIGIALAGTWIYNNWSGIKAMFAGMWDGFMKGIEPVMPALRPIVDGASSLFSSLSGLLGPLDASEAKWRSWGETVGGVAAAGVRGMVSAIQQVVSALRSAWDMAKKAGDAVANFFGVGSKTPTKLSGSQRRAARTGRRDSGGPVMPGKQYLVGEKRPEIFEPGRMGTIRPMKDGIGGNQITATINVPIQYSGDGDPGKFQAATRGFIREEVREAFRGLYADTDMRFS